MAPQCSEIPRKERGERVADIEDDLEFRTANDHKYRAFKSGRMPYTRHNQQEILNFLGKIS